MLKSKRSEEQAEVDVSPFAKIDKQQNPEGDVDILHIYMSAAKNPAACCGDAELAPAGRKALHVPL